MGKELLLVIEAVSNEKNIDQESLFQGIENAIEMATKKHYNKNWNIRVNIDRKTGKYNTFRCYTVIEDNKVLDDMESYIYISEAKKEYPNIKISEIIAEQIQSVDFGRISTQIAKQIIIQKVREAERNRIAKQYKWKIGKLLHGTVKRITRENIFLDLGESVEGIMPKNEILPGEFFRTNDKVKSCLKELYKDKKGSKLILSRISPEMLIQLFYIEVPEIAEEIIEIKSAVRDPGQRSKISVKTNDGRIDPVGACVGIRGSRVQSVSNELGGERIDIVLWDSNIAKYAINAMSPAEVQSIIIDEDKKNMEIVVEEKQLSQAIGKNGQNVKLASQLINWNLIVTTNLESQKKKEKESQYSINLFSHSLGIEKKIAHIIVDSGITTLEELAYVSLEEVNKLNILDKNIFQKLQEKANTLLLSQALKIDKKKPSNDLLFMEGMDMETAKLLVEKGILSRENLAEQSVDDLLDIGINHSRAAKLIMTARAPWFSEKKIPCKK